MPGGPKQADHAYRILEKMITFQELAPGSLVSEAQLVDRTGFGRTPVREALQRLAMERMVDIHPRRGILIAGVTIESQLQLLELRRSLEQLAVGLAAQRATEQHRAAMRELAEKLDRFEGTDVQAFGPLLRESHGLVTAAAHNDYLLVAMAPLQGLSRRFWFANLRDVATDLRDGANLHSAILTAIFERDVPAAEAASLRLNDYLTDFAYRTVHKR